MAEQRAYNTYLAVDDRLVWVRIPQGPPKLGLCATVLWTPGTLRYIEEDRKISPNVFNYERDKINEEYYRCISILASNVTRISYFNSDIFNF